MRASHAVLAAAIAMVSGCASTSSPQAGASSLAAVPTSATTSASAPPAPTASASAPPAAASSKQPNPVDHNVDDTANGSTLQVRVGDTVRVTLHSTYWEMDPPATSAVKASDTAVAASRGPVPGSGTGTVVTSYLMLTSGSATITAHRTSCGEALLCPPEMRTYMVSIDIAAK